MLRGGCAAGLEGLGGRKDHGSIPEAGSHDRGSVSPMLHAGKNYRLRPESSATHAVFLVQRYEFLSAQGTAFISASSHSLGTPHKVLCAGAADAYDSRIHPAAFLAAGRVSWPARRDYLLSGSLFPSLPLCSVSLANGLDGEMGRCGVTAARSEGGERRAAAALSGSGCGCSPHTSIKCKQGGAPTTQSCAGCIGQTLQAAQTPAKDFSSPRPLCIPW